MGKVPQLQTLNRGNEADYVLGTTLGWQAFDVVRWRGVEGLSELFELDIVLARDAEQGAVDIEALIDTAATFRIATEARWRQIHGIVAEAELIEHTAALLLYRVVLVPQLWRSQHRRHCRIFVDKSIEQIVSSVLENRAAGGIADGSGGLLRMTDQPAAPPEQPSFESFKAATGEYRWALTDPERAAEPRKQVVQYNESDFAFVSRLLEAEGISFFFEHTADACIMTLSDRPGHAPLFARDHKHALVSAMVSGAARGQEVVRSLRARGRLRAGAVRMRDYAWRKSLTRLEAHRGSGELEHYEYPARDEDSATDPGGAPAATQLERFETERQLSEGIGTVRTHEPGYRFVLGDRAALRDDRELLVTRVETHAVQLLPEATVLDFEPIGINRSGPPSAPFFENRFEVLPATVRYRPSRATPVPLIAGVQPAIVTAEEKGNGTKLNSDDFGRVRVRFRWDQREPDGTPSSKRVRVAQYWAGPGYGALYVPRVGHEVLVAFEHGNPDRPVIIGRVYTGQNRPPYDSAGKPTVSTLKSQSVKDDGSYVEGFNEWRFEDKAGEEEIYLHAQRNLNETILANHSTSVGGSQSNTVGGNQSNEVHGSRTHHVHGTEGVQVDADRTTVFGANESHSVSGNRATRVGGNDALEIGGDHCINVGGRQEVGIGTSQQVTTGGPRIITVGATQQVTVGGTHVVQNAGTYASTAPDHAFTSSGSFTIFAGGATLRMADGMIALDNGAGASIVLAGGAILVNSGSVMDVTGGQRTLMSGGTTNIGSGGPTNINAGGNINANAPNIKLNG